MEVNEDVMAANKRAFLNFLDEDVGKGFYMKAIRDMVQNKRCRLILGMDDIRSYSLDLARRLIRNPGDFIQPISDALTEVTRNVDPKYLKEGERVLAGFSGPFGFHKVTPRDLMSSFIGSMVCVEGIVTKCMSSSSHSACLQKKQKKKGRRSVKLFNRLAYPCLITTLSN
ncbi:DNA replication licensing factor MCM3 homolog 1-like [Dendrobium catenatum]|uniref:DNA replication licensing factor MCM3 like 1 n=1 Tax=Dendrobium catenatum TaxID=906689 RepID=A0A2I0WK43_9ASPA|nr:DNA replication licensing factor MCM3 homolog 1-like [Dendrobium catenatum]PKU76028.1 DNA replication licensing factor MCM3 like 1 [Dendrobium catenatum]